MPILSAEANKLTNPSLQRGVVEVIIERGAKDLLQYLPFKGFEGEAYAFNMEKTLPSDSSARDPYGTNNLPGGVGTRERTSVASGMLSRNADTAKIDVVGKSNISDQRMQDTILASKKLARDFMEQFVSGNGLRYNLKGLDYWADYFPTVNADYGSQIVYNTNTELATGTKAALSLNAIDDLLSRYKGDRFQLILSNRETYVEYRNLLSAAGGNVASMFMENNFGQRVPMYDGIPWLVLDPVGAVKAGTDGDYDHTGGAYEKMFTVNVSTDPYWIGFTKLDIGKTITLGNGNTGVIDDVKTEKIVTFVSGTQVSAAADAADQTFSVAATNVIYALRFDEEDGIASIFHSGMGSGQKTGDYYGPIAGWDAEDLGLLEDSQQYRTRLSWFGNFVVHNPFSIARLSHFTV